LFLTYNAFLKFYNFIILFLIFSGPFLFSQDLEQIGKGRPVKLSGTLSVQGGPYIYIGKGQPRNEPFWWQINGSPTLSIYGWQLPFSFNYGSRNRSFNQPFNRFGVSPYYRWATFHFGYRSMRMNPYVMSGLQFLGAGVELNPKGFRFATFYGRFAKPLAQDTAANINPTNTAYKRMGYGIKIGVGNKRTFVDLSVVKVQDDTSSIAPPPDSVGIFPQNNLVIGLGGRIALGKKISFQFDAGGSFLNRNLRLVAMDTFQTFTAFKQIFVPHLGAQFLKAGQASIQYFERHYGLKIQYKRVDPDYRSLAAFYQQSDLQSITLEPSFRLFKNKVRISGSIGKQQDNLYHRKAYTSVRSIGSANVNWTPGKNYGINLSFSNYGMAQQAGLQVLNDTFRIAQNNQSISFGQNYSNTDKKRTISLAMNISYQQLQDLNPFGTYAAGENQVWFANINGNRVRLSDNLGVQGGFNFSRNQFSGGNYLLIGPTLGFSKPLIKEKLQSSATISYNKGFQNGSSSGATVNLSSSMQYQVNKTHQFNITINVLHNSTTFLKEQSFTEIRMLAGYVLIFKPKS